MTFKLKASQPFKGVGSSHPMTASYSRRIEPLVRERLHLEDEGAMIPQSAGELLAQWHSVTSQKSWILSARTASAWRWRRYNPCKHQGLLTCSITSHKNSIFKQFLNQQNSYYILWSNHTDAVVTKSKLPSVWWVPCRGFRSPNRHCQLQRQILLFLGDIFLQL